MGGTRQDRPTSHDDAYGGAPTDTSIGTDRTANGYTFACTISYTVTYAVRDSNTHTESGAKLDIELIVELLIELYINSDTKLDTNHGTCARRVLPSVQSGIAGNGRRNVYHLAHCADIIRNLRSGSRVEKENG